jgi:hypothetical protein
VAVLQEIVVVSMGEPGHLAHSIPSAAQKRVNRLKEKHLRLGFLVKEGARLVFAYFGSRREVEDILIPAGKMHHLHLYLHPSHALFLLMAIDQAIAFAKAPHPLDVAAGFIHLSFSS